MTAKKKPTPPRPAPVKSREELQSQSDALDEAPHPASAPEPERRRAPRPTSADERTLPHNLDAERSVLGAIIANNAGFERASQLVRGRHFYRDSHRRIFDAIERLIDERKSAADFVTLKEELARKGELDECGGPGYLAGLADGVPGSTNVKYYAGIVREKARLRDVIYAANRMLVEAYEAQERAEDIIGKADRELLDIQREGGGEGVVVLREGLTALMERLAHRDQHRGELTGINTGFTSINEVTFGWQKPDMIVVAARPSIGKTAFTLEAAIAACGQGGVVAMFSLEMRRKQIEERLLSRLSGVDLSRIQSGYFGALDYPKLAAGVELMRDMLFFINDRSGQNTWDIRGECRRLKAEHGRLDLVIIDYVQLMPGTLTGREKGNRYAEVTDISRRVKNDIAGDLDVPTFLLSQLNRGQSKRNDPRPRLEDLRESGRLEEDADIVAFLHRPNHLASGTTQFIIAKQRNGSGGTMNLTFTRETQTFTDGGEELPEPVKKERKGKPSDRTRRAKPPSLPSIDDLGENPVDEPATAEAE